MSHPHHSDATQAELIARIPTYTGRSLENWMSEIDRGPSLLRFEERVNWMRTEHDLPLGYANALVHQYDLTKAERRSG